MHLHYDYGYIWFYAQKERYSFERNILPFNLITLHLSNGGISKVRTIVRLGVCVAHMSVSNTRTICI